MNGSENNQYHDVPSPSGAAETELQARIFAGQLHEAIERTPLGLQEHIGQRAEGDPVLFEQVLVGCRGDRELADLLIDKAVLEGQRNHPTYVHSIVAARLNAVNEQIERKRDELNEAKH